MKPVLVLQHLRSDGPAYLGSWLRSRGIAHAVRDAQAGDAWPASIEPYAALAVLGGEMSANDPLPSLRLAETLIREAMALGRPVIGHCLGGQLMARALGARVRRSPAPEIGWQPLQVFDHDEARAWFGSAGQRHVCQWHEEAFELPPGAVPLAGSGACPQQAFAIGPHLAMQFHVEIDVEKLRRWSCLDTPAYRDAQRCWPTVQAGAAMRADAEHHLAGQQRLADRIYARWWAAAADSA